MKAKLTAIVLALCATFALAATSACADESVAGTSWCITEQTDKITDAVSYLIATIAKESEEESQLEDKTLLVARIEPKGRTKNGNMNFRLRFFLHHQEGSLGVGRAKITTRFDREEAVTSTWRTLPPSYELAVAPETDAMFSKLETSTNLTVRFTTIIGEIKTLTFSIGGFASALDKVKAKYLATNPPTIPDAKPAAAPNKTASSPCRKCKGKGTIIGWTNCPRCNGDVMPGGLRCQFCIKSVHVGKVRGEIPCPVCHPNANTSTQSGGFGKGK